MNTALRSKKDEPHQFKEKEQEPRENRGGREYKAPLPMAPIIA